ncbi:toxin-antitoxin system HicB family antitoxin [candidate division KSB1 bacterium]|nr:toxin-antitoxin system HicB family antitoxin [candidate division KSB1 bacterium]
MPKSNVLTLRVPWELKHRLEKEARFQGVSINQLSNYLLSEQLTKIETISQLEMRLAKKSISE